MPQHKLARRVTGRMIAFYLPLLAIAAYFCLPGLRAHAEPPAVDSASKSPAPAPAPKPAEVPQTITSPLGKKLSLKFHDEFDPVPDKDGQPYIDRCKWQTTFWQGSSQRTLWGNLEAQYYVDKDYGGGVEDQAR